MKRSQTLKDPASPSRLALYSYIIFLVAWLFPPPIYTSIIREPDLMFLNPTLFIFFTVCTLSFVGGIRSVGWFIRSGPEHEQHKVVKHASVITLCMPVILCTLWALAFLHDVGTHIDLVSLLFSQEGNIIKESGASFDLSTGRLALSIPFLIGSLWWSYTRFKTKESVPGFWRVLFWSVFAAGFFVCALVCVARVDRVSMMPLVLGTMIVAVHHSYRAGRLNRKKLFVVAILIIGSVGGIFAIFSYLRGFNSFQLLLWTLMGYSIAAYNRMASVLAGMIQSPFPGKPIHLVAYLLESARLEDVFHFRAALSWPDSYTLFLLEFPQVYSHGLAGALIWLGFFGYIYTDLGWFSPLYIYAIGFLTGWAWIRFQQRKILGLVLYPWFGFCILFWVGSSIELNETFVYLIEVATVLWVYEQLFFRTVPSVWVNVEPSSPQT